MKTDGRTTALLETFGRCFLALIFAYAGMAKIWDVHQFSHVVASVSWIPFGVVNPVAIALPIFELLCALALILRPVMLRRAASLGMSLLLLTFLTLWTQVIIGGREFNCSCFGKNVLLEAGGPWVAMIRNGMLLAMALWIYYRESPRAKFMSVAKFEMSGQP